MDPGNSIVIFTLIQDPVSSSETSLFGNYWNIIAPCCFVLVRYLLICPALSFPTYKMGMIAHPTEDIAKHLRTVVTRESYSSTYLTLAETKHHGTAEEYRWTTLFKFFNVL